MRSMFGFPQAILFGLALIHILILPAAAQPPNEGVGEAFFDSVSVEIVNVEVFVTDKKDEPVSGLTAESFELWVDGKPVPITNFYAEVGGQGGAQSSGPKASPPAAEGVPAVSEGEATPPSQQLHLLIFVDNRNLRPTNRKKSFKYLRRFLAEDLSPEVPVAVAALGASLAFVSDFTRDRDLLEEALDKVQEGGATVVSATAELQRIADTIAESSGDLTLGVRIKAAAETEFNRAKASVQALGAVVDSVAGIHGRKAILYLSDGISTNPGEALYYAAVGSFDAAGYRRNVGSFDLMPDFQELARRANAAEVTLYPLDAEPGDRSLTRSAEGTGSMDQPISPAHSRLAAENSRAPLELAAADTGGRRVEASGRLAQHLLKIGNDFGSFYSLGFRAPEDASQIKHRIEVKVAGKGYRVRHRQAYEDKDADHRSAEAVIAALLYGSSEGTLGVAFEPLARRAGDDGLSVLPVKLKIPISRVAFLPEGDQQKAQLSFFFTVKDEKGNLRPVQKVPFKLRIPAEKMEEARGRTADYELPVALQPGDRQLAIGVRDDIAGIRSTLRLEL